MKFLSRAVQMFLTQSRHMHRQTSLKALLRTLHQLLNIVILISYKIKFFVIDVGNINNIFTLYLNNYVKNRSYCADISPVTNDILFTQAQWPSHGKSSFEISILTVFTQLFRYWYPKY